MKYSMDLRHVLGFVLLAWIRISQASQKILKGNGPYVGIPGKMLTLKWTYIGSKMFDHVEIYIPDSTPGEFNRLWRIQYFSKNNSLITYKFDVPHSVFDNLTEFVRKGSELHLNIKSVPRNLTSFRFLCRMNLGQWEPMKESENKVRVAVHPTAQIIIEKGKEVHVPKGREVSIRCTGNGFPTPNFEIRKDSLLLVSSSAVGKEAYLKFSAVKSVDAGKYTCTATNVLGTARRDAILTVTYIESKSRTSNMILSSLGKSVDLNCPIEGFPPLSYTWYSNCDRNQPFGWSKEITLKLDKMDKLGNYCCIGQNNIGLRNVSFTIYVEAIGSQSKTFNAGYSLSPSLLYTTVSILMLLWCNS